MNYFVFIALIFQLYVIFKIKRSFGILIHANGYFFTHVARDIEPLRLFHFERIIRTASERRFHLAAFFISESAFDADISGHIKPNCAAAKNFLKGFAFNFNRDVDADGAAARIAAKCFIETTNCGLHKFFAHIIPSTHLDVTKQRHHSGNAEINVADFFRKSDIFARGIYGDFSLEGGYACFNERRADAVHVHTLKIHCL